MAAASGAGAGRPQASGDAPLAVRRMVEATNAGDSTAFLATFTDDAYLEDWGRGFHGPSEIARWDRTDNIGKRSHFVIDGARSEGATDAGAEAWVVTLAVTGDGYNGTSDIRFEVVGDRIRRLLITP